MTITEKVAYLKGLSAGLAIDTEKSKEGKLINAIIDVLEEIGLTIEDLEENAEVLGEEIDALSDDLSDVEEILFDDEDEEEDDCCDFFQVECPGCGEPLDVDEEVLEAGMISCPACNQKFALDLYDDEDDNCGCGCSCGCGEEEAPPAEPAKKDAKKSTKKADK